MYAVVVFAALAPLAGLTCKGRLGGLKEARGGRCAVSIALTRQYLRALYLFLP
jgi:hypothetical protein